MTEIISTINLTKIYRDNVAVDNVNLSINKGEIFGFIGLNGAGKTTTIKILLGMVSPTSGQCYIRGQRVSPGNVDIWKDVGYIVETPYSYPELTVKENLELVRRLRGIEDKGRVDWIMKKLKLESYKSRKAKYLSMGNAQRLGIAKAIIHRPKILMLDEPTNGLDPAGIVEVLQLLRDMADNWGVTVLVSSHKLDEISRIATDIGMIQEGKLIKKVDRKELKKQLKRCLILDGRDRGAIESILSKAGYKVIKRAQGLGKRVPVLQIGDRDAIEHPDRIAELLVNAGHPPTLLGVEVEDLEEYFLRSIGKMGGDMS